MKFLHSFVCGCCLVFTFPAQADWPQWRGPTRNGITDAKTSLPAQLTEENAPVKVWDSDKIPSDREGGHGSVSIADGKVFLSVVWHSAEPSQTRQIDRDVLANLGYRGTSSIAPEVVEKMETDRMNLSRRLRGSALDEWSKEWVETNIDPKTQLSLGSWIAGRFKQGPAAIPLPVYETLLEVSKEPFANQAELESWTDAQNFDPAVRTKILAAVPDTVKVAEDVVLCLDAETGSEIWRFSEPGTPTGRNSSSTPAIADGQVYAVLSENIYCVDADDGSEIWRAPLEGKKGPASSPLVHEGKVYLQQSRLSAFDTKTGEELWNNDAVSTVNPSPALWKDVVLCNSKNELIGVDAYAGGTLWKVPGGGDGTPVVSGDYVIINSKIEGKNLMAYRMTDEKPIEVWSIDFLARRYGSSPVITDDHVYYLGSSRHLCIDLKTGDIKWEREAQSSLSSPLLADGKLLVYENKGGFASIIEAVPDEYRVLGRAKIGALYCASPAMVGRDLFLRTKEGVSCFRFP